MKRLVNEKLVQYVNTNILKMYDLNGEAHGRAHIETVLERANEISKKYDGINYNILYIVVIYHDIGDHIDRKNHEIISAEIMMKDEELNNYFTPEEKIIIKEAIEDHRASKGKIPRSLYGKILASADKNTDINMYFKRCILYEKEHHPEKTKQQILDRAYEHAIEKFGKNGYAVNMYFVEDEKYEEYLKKLQDLIDDKDSFYEIGSKIYEKMRKEKPMKTFEKICTDDEIIDIYYQVNKNEESGDAWAHHNFDHALNVTKLVETILTKLNCSEQIIEQAKIAAILHDVGMVEGKKEHEVRAHDFAKEYFKRNNIKLENEDLVLDAIISHRNGFDTDNIIALALILADKLDVKYTRIAKDGYKVIGMRQIQYIKDVRIDIVDNVFVVKFVCDEKLDKKELEEYYFVEKMANAVRAFCKKMNLEYKVLYNEQLWEKFYNL